MGLSIDEAARRTAVGRYGYHNRREEERGEARGEAAGGWSATHLSFSSPNDAKIPAQEQTDLLVRAKPNIPGRIKPQKNIRLGLMWGS